MNKPSKRTIENRKYRARHPEKYKEERRRWYERHKQEQIERVMIRTQELKAEGKCILCGEEAVNANHCEFHRRKDLERSKKYRLRKKKEKLAQS